MQCSRRDVGADRGERPAPVLSSYLLPTTPHWDLRSANISLARIDTVDRSKIGYAQLYRHHRLSAHDSHSILNPDDKGGVSMARATPVVSAFAPPRASFSRVVATQWGLCVCVHSCPTGNKAQSGLGSRTANSAVCGSGHPTLPKLPPCVK